MTLVKVIDGGVRIGSRRFELGEEFQCEDPSSLLKLKVVKLVEVEIETEPFVFIEPEPVEVVEPVQVAVIEPEPVEKTSSKRKGKR
jgi:hypothetical protein